MDGLAMAGVPERFIRPNLGLDGFEGSAYIHGTVGAGKTTMAVGMLAGWMRDHVVGNAEYQAWWVPKAVFVSARAYVDLCKPGREGADSIRRCPMLVLDDLGQEVPTRFAVSELYGLVDHRYGMELPTVVTSQFTRGDLARRLAQDGGENQALAIASRLVEMCRDVELSGPDRRRSCAG